MLSTEKGEEEERAQKYTVNKNEYQFFSINFFSKHCMRLEDVDIQHLAYTEVGTPLLPPQWNRTYLLIKENIISDKTEAITSKAKQQENCNYLSCNLPGIQQICFISGESHNHVRVTFDRNGDS